MQTQKQSGEKRGLKRPNQSPYALLCPYALSPDVWSWNTPLKVCESLSVENGIGPVSQGPKSFCTSVQFLGISTA